LANVFPRPKINGRSESIVLNTRPPKLLNNGINFTHKGLGEKHNGHIVDRNRGKNKLDVGEPTSMIKLVSFDNGSLALNLAIMNS
jgi:hypothetical protein